MALLSIQGLAVNYASKLALAPLDLEVAPGEWLAVIGPNGSGKTTLVNAIAQAVPYRGSISFEGDNLAALKPRARARCIAVLQQQHEAYYAFTVEEVVAMGRYAWSRGFLRGSGPDDAEAVQHALAACGLEPLRTRRINTLSGGELQRTFLAQIFAQSARLLVLDEATNHLDLAYQRLVFDLIARWLAAAPGRAVVSVVHDLLLAHRYATTALLLQGGKVVAQGDKTTVFSPPNLNRAFGMDVQAWYSQNLQNW
jgi:iron complex transport system ATP-binding protein